jgi:carboxymethylenebutenolidase
VAGEDPKLRAAIGLYDRFTHEGMDRRAFFAELTRIAGGAAAATTMLGTIAAQAACAPQVPEDAPGLDIRTSPVAVRAGRTLNVYGAAPHGRVESAPAVIVVHENRGLNDHIRDVTRRVAQAGFAGYAPDFLTGAGGTPADEDQARTMIGALDMPAAIADGAGLVQALREGGRRKVGIVGFCWGGAMVHRIALAAGRNLSAAVPYYGPAPDPAEAAHLEVPMLVILAGLDTRVNGTAGPYLAALEAAHKPVRSITYPGVDHAFNNDTSAARYNAQAATQAWAETLAFFRQHLR